MSYVTKDTVWPVPAIDCEVKVKEVIAKFYDLADSKSPDAGPRMASEVFTSNASITTPGGTFEGAEGTTLPTTDVGLPDDFLTEMQPSETAARTHGPVSPPEIIASTTSLPQVQRDWT
ncbi:hypothetical protein NM208_g7746 [Fusarium decemcellulare]|uniref:Uncharacterized protein n=1 Tax=Fusarium decemcellulare TaxID=57161 RepID=A0ACC1S826_9HYPO|nr:hypothetical protein NM208_g7746 [Fusarium decemcellulare]